MDDELTTYGTARIMVTNTTYDICADLADQIERIDGVTSATFGEDTVKTDADTTGDDEDARRHGGHRRILQGIGRPHQRHLRRGRG